MAKLSGKVPLRLRIVGKGSKLAEVLNLASQLGVRGSIELTGTMPIEEVAAEMRRADVGISCHRAGIFGDLYFSTKILEYLSQGLPVLSPRTYTISRYLPDDCLFYFTPGDDAALVETIQFLWSNRNEVMRRLSKARKTLARLTWQSEKDSFCRFYEQLLEGESVATRIEDRHGNGLTSGGALDDPQKRKQTRETVVP
jgi:glycosyltransferase involved in cell wall biosynthesis